jgi:hypothetical protein
VRATAYPQARQFADIHILNPPSSDDMAAAFEKLAIDAGARR